MSKFKHVFGPVPSRRMGLSIGVSPIEDGHCNYSCVYCQLGRTKRMRNKLEEYFPCEEILDEFREYIKDDIAHDVVTVVGDGDPSLYANLEELILGLKELTDRPIAVITNGALLTEESVRKALMHADIILPSLDATDEKMFREINRPHGTIEFEEFVEALKSFSKEFQGQLWIESMILKGMNDNREFYLELKDMLEDIDYHRLYINTPVRPPAESFIEEPAKESIEEAIAILGGVSIDKLASDGFSSGIEDDYEAVLDIIKRHPMNQFEIRAFLKDRGNEDIDGFMERLDADEGVEVVNYKNYLTYRLNKGE